MDRIKSDYIVKMEHINKKDILSLYRFGECVQVEKTFIVKNCTTLNEINEKIYEYWKQHKASNKRSEWKLASITQHEGDIIIIE